MRARDDRGAAAVTALALVGLLTVVGLLAAVMTGAVIAQRRVQSAADLAAITGAEALTWGRDPCTAAAEIVARHQVELQSCEAADQVVVIVTALDLPLGSAVRARARAGPALQDHVQELRGPDLVERTVLIAALG